MVAIHCIYQSTVVLASLYHSTANGVHPFIHPLICPLIDPSVRPSTILSNLWAFEHFQYNQNEHIEIIEWFLKCCMYSSKLMNLASVNWVFSLKLSWSKGNYGRRKDKMNRSGHVLQVKMHDIILPLTSSYWYNIFEWGAHIPNFST